MTLLTPATDLQSAASPATVRDRVVLRAKGLKKSFGGQTVLNGIDLELRQGEVVLLRGENGSGKTTLLNILTGNLEPDSGTLDYLADGTPRSYSFPRRWWQELNPFDHFTPEFVAREGIGRTWQDVRLFGAQSLRDNIAVAEPGHPGENPLIALIAPGYANRREANLNQQADAMLSRLGLAGREGSSADMISLGQSKRVAIARAVAAGAKILFLDEPLAGLDRQGINDVLTLLEALVNDHDLTLVVVEHIFNQPHIHGLVSTDWLLESGKLKRNGRGSSQYPISNYQSAIASRPAWFTLLASDDAEIIDEPLPRGALLTRIRRPDRWKPNAKPVLEIKDLIVKRGPRTVIGLDTHGDTIGFNLTLYEGEIAILQAQNGWGKSTLFAAIAGLIASHGCVEIDGFPLSLKGCWKRVKRGLNLLPSNEFSFPVLSVGESHSLRGSHESFGAEVLNKSRTLESLSGGERRLHHLLMTSLADSRQQTVTIIDEPFLALDQERVAIAAKLLYSAPWRALLLLQPSSI